MLTILNLFGRSPFAPLRTHMEKVSLCIARLCDLFYAMRETEYEQMQQIADEISQLEHAADLTKNDIRNHLPKTYFLPIDRGNLLDILSLQDAIADAAEDVAVATTLQRLHFLPSFQEDFFAFLEKNMEAFQEVKQVIAELNELLESSFGGMEAEKVQRMIEKVAFFEHEADILQRTLLKKLIDAEESITFITFHLWLRIFESVASISNLSEKLANRVRMTLDIK